MANKTSESLNYKQTVHSVALGTNAGEESTYDADNFLYGAVPFGEYPEVTAASIKDTTATSAKNQPKQE